MPEPIDAELLERVKDAYSALLDYVWRADASSDESGGGERHRQAVASRLTVAYFIAEAQAKKGPHLPPARRPPPGA